MADLPLVESAAVSVVFVDADVFLSPHTVGARTVPVLLRDADVLAEVAVVTTGWGWLWLLTFSPCSCSASAGVSLRVMAQLEALLTSSVLDSYTLLSLDFGGL